MKILLLCLLISTIYADNEKIVSSIFNNIVSSLSEKNNASVYIHSSLESLEKHPGNLKIVQDCSEADIVILSEVKNIPYECNNKILFGTRYYHLKNPNVIGAFFWQKGRPNILFYKRRLDEHNIKLVSSFDKYVEP